MTSSGELREDMWAKYASLPGEDGGERVRHQARQPSHRPSSMLGDAVLAREVMAARLLEKGVYVTGFFYPVAQGARASGCR